MHWKTIMEISCLQESIMIKKVRNTSAWLRSMWRVKIEEQALYDAYVESERSLDEIIDLIQNADEWI